MQQLGDERKTGTINSSASTATLSTTLILPDDDLRQQTLYPLPPPGYLSDSSIIALPLPSPSISSVPISSSSSSLFSASTSQPKIWETSDDNDALWNSINRDIQYENGNNNNNNNNDKLKSKEVDWLSNRDGTGQASTSAISTSAAAAAAAAASVSSEDSQQQQHYRFASLFQKWHHSTGVYLTTFQNSSCAFSIFIFVLSIISLPMKLENGVNVSI